ncbi:hypothetical protein VZT92_002953 [Zoarces viviparus]|uniref:Uncharacterized protein n=1 Tax=Zoarces viviparus TaxID=48416 RepID=A0AAW1G216_ZOAVI
MGGRETRVNNQEDGWTGLPSRRQALHSIAVVASSESSAGIGAAPLNTSRGNEWVGPDDYQQPEFGWSDRSPQRNKEGTAVK